MNIGYGISKSHQLGSIIYLSVGYDTCVLTHSLPSEKILAQKSGAKHPIRKLVIVAKKFNNKMVIEKQSQINVRSLSAEV